MQASAIQACLLIMVWHCAERILAVALPRALELSVALSRQPRLLAMLAYHVNLLADKSGAIPGLWTLAQARTSTTPSLRRL